MVHEECRLAARNSHASKNMTIPMLKIFKLGLNVVLLSDRSRHDEPLHRFQFLVWLRTWVLALIIEEFRAKKAMWCQHNVKETRYNPTRRVVSTTNQYTLRGCRPIAYWNKITNLQNWNDGFISGRLSTFNLNFSENLRGRELGRHWLKRNVDPPPRISTFEAPKKRDFHAIF